MEGVTILNTIPGFSPILLVVLLFIIFIFGLSILSYGKVNKISDGRLLLVFIATILAFVAMITCFFIPSQPKRYEVTISDDVTFNDFVEKYKIIEERGQIFIIEERESYKEANQDEPI